MSITRRCALNLLSNMFMSERDALNNTALRITGGFAPPSVLADARCQLHNITTIVHKLEECATKPKDEVIAVDYWDFKRKLMLKWEGGKKVESFFFASLGRRTRVKDEQQQQVSKRMVL